ncbi:sodium/proline symporter PutP [Exilibacterium tricleocarpae]|uniref:Sodium/proline symporter n=1 Tax=Exilibacterium tricleocarpae TaxID=2591008 RepID=A0A545SY80_9GAMM|nr:sodium/proline symporter PutP [Exilibacterium tricleocarpae]TQV69924.1 sodium/proline symporter PutP [Exilibacterium tricleocarpae]
MVENQWAIGLTFTLYLAGMFAIGLWSYLRTKDMSDYILGGRSLGPLPSALSAGASDMSGWLLLGLPGYAYVAGVEAGWIALGLLTGTWLNWRVVARRLRIYSYKMGDCLTISDYLENRFRDNSRLLRIISALIILFFFLFYTSSGLVAGGKLFETVFGLDYRLAVIVGTIAVVSYTLFGGFLAVAWTDVVQGLLMSAALVIVPVAAIEAMGGVAAIQETVAAKNPALLDLWTGTSGESIGAISIFSLLGWGLGYFGQPHILARFKAIRSEEDIPAARRVAVAWATLTLVGSLICGFVAIAYFGEPLEDSERAFMLLIDALFNPLVAGILLAAILAAVMSTADSQLLVASSALAEDFYRALFRQNASQRELVKVGRLAVVLIALVASYIALEPENQVLTMVSYAWAGFGAAFGPTIVFSLYWRRMNRNGALAGIIVGGITVVVWKNLSGGIFELYELIPAFFMSSAAIAIVSLVTAEPVVAIKQQSKGVTHGV